MVPVNDACAVELLTPVLPPEEGRDTHGAERPAATPAQTTGTG